MITVYFLKLVKIFGQSEKGERNPSRNTNMSKIRGMGGNYLFRETVVHCDDK